jgi:predicted DNA-binding protein
METVRLNLTLPKEIATKLNLLVGSKSKSAFIAECLERRIAQIEDEKLKNLMVEGYQNTKAESLDFAREFEPVDLEGWDEY